MQKGRPWRLLVLHSIGWGVGVVQISPLRALGLFLGSILLGNIPPEVRLVSHEQCNAVVHPLPCTEHRSSAIGRTAAPGDEVMPGDNFRAPTVAEDHLDRA